VNILVERAEQTERNLTQIVLDESLSVVSKLTNSQLDSLTLIFLFRYTSMNLIASKDRLKEYLINNIKPFTNNLTRNNSHYQHLEYANCASISVLETKIEEIITRNYKGVFCDEFSFSEVIVNIPSLFARGNIDFLSADNYEDYKNIIMKFHGGTTDPIKINNLMEDLKVKFNIINDKRIDEFIVGNKFDVQEEMFIKSRYNSKLITNQDVKSFLLSVGGFMNVLLDVWEHSSLRLMQLTSVGIAIARANYLRKVNGNVDLSQWIKDN
jgi:hypothetical protein